MLSKSDRCGTSRIVLGATLLVFSTSFIYSGFWTASVADSNPNSVVPQTAEPAKIPPHAAGGYRADTLIVVANPKADADDISDALHEVRGTIERKVKVGAQEFLLIKTEKGKLEETMKTLSNDKDNFSIVQKNYTSKKQQLCNVPNDPRFASQYELTTLNIPTGWCAGATGSGQTIAILDTGVNPVSELSGKVRTGFNANAGSGQGNFDTDPGSLGHGTSCATTAAALSNNSLNTSSPAYNSQIYPIIISDAEGYSDDLSLIAAIGDCMSKNIRIASCSFNATPPYSFSNIIYHRGLHTALDTYYQSGGLFFNAAGNEKKTIKDPQRPYLIVVAATDAAMKLAKFSNKGKSVWFAAPGSLVQCTTKSGYPTYISGTSFSTPLVAGVASMIWSKYPGENNGQILTRLVNTANRTYKGYKATTVGFGVPNAGAAAN
jgi:subtilisin family serine protease